MERERTLAMPCLAHHFLKISIVFITVTLMALSGFSAEANSRRSFLGGACIFAMTAAPSFLGARLLDGIFHGEDEEVPVDGEEAEALIAELESVEPLTPEEMLKQAEGDYEALHPEGGEGREHEVTIETTDGKTYVRTMTDKHLFMLGHIFAANVFPWLGHGSSTAIHRMANNEPLEWYIKATIFAPVEEEALFRLLPRLIFGDGWVPGTISSIVFGAIHFGDGERIPVGHFFSGLLQWHFMKHRGLDHAIIAHWGNNHTATLLTWL